MLNNEFLDVLLVILCIVTVAISNIDFSSRVHSIIKTKWYNNINSLNDFLGLYFIAMTQVGKIFKKKTSRNKCVGVSDKNKS